MILLAVALLIFILGLLVRYKKVSWLISGYNTASKEKQAEYDQEKLTRYVGNFLFVLAGCCLIWGIIMVMLPQHFELVFWSGFAIAFIVIGAGLLYLNTGKRLMKK